MLNNSYCPGEKNILLNVQYQLYKGRVLIIGDLLKGQLTVSGPKYEPYFSCYDRKEESGS